MTTGIPDNLRDTIQGIRTAHDTLDFEEVAQDIVKLFWDLYESRPDIEELATWITEQEASISGYGKKYDQKSLGSNLIAFLRFIGRAYGCAEESLSKITKIEKAFDAAADDLDLTAFANQLENWVNVLFECVGSHVRLPVIIENDQVRIGRHCKISFNRTLRIPEDGKDYPLPANFGRLPICRVEDYAEKVPEKWLSEGGFFIPLYQKEALFLEFEGQTWRPCAAKVAIGRVNAVTGEEYDERIRSHKQDYLVIPEQKWLDGINSGEGRVGQFVAMPLGKGYTVEAQVTDEETHGGFQVTVFDPKNGRFSDEDPDQVALRKQNLKQRSDQVSSGAGGALFARPRSPSPPAAGASPCFPGILGAKSPLEAQPLPDAGATQLQARRNVGDLHSSSRGDGTDPFADAESDIAAFEAALNGGELDTARIAEMGIAKGGSIKQEIVEDTYGSDSWNEVCRGSIVIHIVNSEVFQLITGRETPSTPITIEQYAKYEIPWFDYYDETAPALLPAKKLQHIQSVGAIEKLRGVASPIPDRPIKVSPERLKKIRTPDRGERIADFVQRSENSFRAGCYKIAVRESTYAIDLLDKSESGALAPSVSALFETALQIRAESNLALARYHAAEGDASDCLVKNAGNISALSTRAQALIGMGEHDLAIAEAKILLSSNPAHAGGLRVLAEGLLGSGAYYQAVIKATAVLKYYSRDVTAYRVRAEAYLRIEKHTEAMHDATAALIYGDSEIRALLTRAEAFLQLANPYDARQDLEEVLRMDADNEEAMVLLAKVKKSRAI